MKPNVTGSTLTLFSVVGDAGPVGDGSRPAAASG